MVLNEPYGPPHDESSAVVRSSKTQVKSRAPYDVTNGFPNPTLDVIGQWTAGTAATLSIDATNGVSGGNCLKAIINTTTIEQEGSFSYVGDTETDNLSLVGIEYITFYVKKSADSSSRLYRVGISHTGLTTYYTPYFSITTSYQKITVKVPSYLRLLSNDFLVRAATGLIDEDTLYLDNFATHILDSKDAVIDDLEGFITDSTADTIDDSIGAPVPVTANATRRLAYRREKENVVNGDFLTDIDGWTAQVGSGANEPTLVGISASATVYHTAANGLLVDFDIPLNCDGNIYLIYENVDLRNVENITLWCRVSAPPGYVPPTESGPFWVNLAFLYGELGSTDAINLISLTDSYYQTKYSPKAAWEQFQLEGGLPEAQRVKDASFVIRLNIFDTATGTSDVNVVFDEIMVMGNPPSFLAFEDDADVVHGVLNTPEEPASTQCLCTDGIDPEVSSNAFTNGDFEGSGITPFTYDATYGGSIVQSTAQAHGGTHSALASVTYIGYLMYSGLDLTGITQITFWAYTTASSVQCAFGAGPEGDVQYGDEFTLTAGAWTQYTYTVPEAQRTTDRDFSLYVMKTYGVTFDVYIDDVYAEKITVLETYKWESMCRWRGAAATAPSDPVAGDVWIDTSSTPVTKVYSGSVWV